MASTIQCASCETWNPPQASRCRRCGRSLRASGSTAPSRAWVSPRPKVQAIATEAAPRLEKREVASVAPAPGSEPATRAATPPEVNDSPAAALPAPEPRLPTLVRGLDEALGGGIPRGFVVLLEGAPGTMKSSLAFWILAGNASANGARGLYLACEESEASLLRQMRSVGVDLDAVRERVTILDSGHLPGVLNHAGGDWLAGLREAVEAVRRDASLDLLVLDSLEALEVLAKFPERRHALFRLFEWLRELGVTSFVVAEREDFVVQGIVLQGRHDENFLADGVLHLRLHMTSDLTVQRRIRIVKMRGTRHETGYLALHVGERELEVDRAIGG